jgi:GTPase SAR1 family protein
VENGERNNSVIALDPPVGGRISPQLLSLLHELRLSVEGQQSPLLLTAIDEEIKKLASGCFHLAVLGQSKRGKTTFINALLGDEILPAGVIPVTAVVTLVRYGPQKRSDVIFDDSRRLEIELDSLASYISEDLNPKNEKGVRYVEIFYPIDLLQQGLVLIDTPGIGSVYLHNTETTQSFIPKVDAAIFVLSSDPIMTQTECDFLNEVAQHIDRVFFVLNKVDLLDSRELGDVLSFTERILIEKLPQGTLAIYPVSSRDALLGSIKKDAPLLQRSRVRAIEEIIRTFLAQHGNAVLAKRSGERVRQLLREVRYFLELEKKAVETPLLDLEVKTEFFEERAAALRKERGLTPYTLQGQIDLLTAWIDKEMERFAEAATEVLKARARQSVQTGNVRSYRDRVQRETEELAAELVTRIQQWRTRVEPQIVDRYQKIIDEYVDGVNSFVSDIHELSRELFNVTLSQFSFVEPLLWKRTFYYRVEDEPVFLEIDWTNAASKVLPKSYLRRRMTATLLAFIDDKITRNCNNLKYEYSYSIEEHARTFQSELDRKMDDIVASIQDVLRRTSCWEKEREADAEEILRALCARLKRVDELEGNVPENP